MNHSLLIIITELGTVKQTLENYDKIYQYVFGKKSFLYTITG